jgi:pyrophosphate--fructose-6-phosphate 1-phosphotransferase
VKLTNVKDCVKRGLVKEGQEPQKVAADQLVKDGVDVLHTIGGDDTNTAAADLAAFLARNNYGLTVIGLPKTIDNDVYPIRQSLGAWTAAEQGARYFRNVVAEHSANPRMLIIHEVMGRNCGWLTAATAQAYRRAPRQRILRCRGSAFPATGSTSMPSMCRRCRSTSPPKPPASPPSWIAVDNVNIFISEGAASRASSPSCRPAARRCRAMPSATSNSTPSTPASGSASSSPR